METMYDKLGDLLSQTLENGHIPFVKVPKEEKQAQEEIPKQKENHTEKESSPHCEEKKENVSDDFASFRKKKRRTYTIYRSVPPQIASCYALLNIPYDADKKQVKAAYKQLLKDLHPDRHSASSAELSAATERTQQVVEAYKQILQFLK